MKRGYPKKKLGMCNPIFCQRQAQSNLFLIDVQINFHCRRNGAPCTEGRYEQLKALDAIMSVSWCCQPQFCRAVTRLWSIIVVSHGRGPGWGRGGEGERMSHDMTLYASRGEGRRDSVACAMVRATDMSEWVYHSREGSGMGRRHGLGKHDE